MTWSTTRLFLRMALAFFLVTSEGAIATAAEPEVGFPSNHVEQRLVFASPAVAAQLLAREDTYAQMLTPFDIKIRTGSAPALSRRDFLKFAGKQALPWSSADISRVRAAFHAVLASLARSLSAEDTIELLPNPLYIVQSTGLEEGGSSYTRDNAIVFSRDMLRTQDLNRLLAHELFHVLSKSLRPHERDWLFQSLGYKVRSFPPKSLPAEIRGRVLNNPDSLGVAIGAALASAPEEGARQDLFFPLLSANVPPMSGNMPLNIAMAIEPVGLVMHETASGSSFSVVRRDDPEFESYLAQEQITRAIERHPERIQPEEIAAENFASVALGESPRLGRQQAFLKLAPLLRQIAEQRRR